MVSVLVGEHTDRFFTTENTDNSVVKKASLAITASSTVPAWGALQRLMPALPPTRRLGRS